MEGTFSSGNSPSRIGIEVSCDPAPRSDMRDPHGAPGGTDGPGADLFEGDRMMLIVRGEERIASRPLSQPEAQHADIKRHRTIEVAHFEMHVAETQSAGGAEPSVRREVP